MAEDIIPDGPHPGKPETRIERPKVKLQPGVIISPEQAQQMLDDCIVPRELTRRVFVLTGEEYDKLREVFRWRGHVGPSIAKCVQELCDMIQQRTGKEYEQYT